MAAAARGVPVLRQAARFPEHGDKAGAEKEGEKAVSDTIVADARVQEALMALAKNYDTALRGVKWTAPALAELTAMGIAVSAIVAAHSARIDNHEFLRGWIASITANAETLYRAAVSLIEEEKVVADGGGRA